MCPKNLDTAASLLCRSACKLTKFVCYQCEDANALIEVVRASTSIKYLYIEDCGADFDELIIWLSVEEDAAPNLEIVEDSEANLYKDVGLFQLLLFSRMPCGFHAPARRRA
jgi:hypothetical protein